MKTRISVDKLAHTKETIVTLRRDRAWLQRWLKEPDKMLAEKDPTAINLYNRYNKIIMPNLRLSDSDIEVLILFMEAADKQSHVH